MEPRSSQFVLSKLSSLLSSGDNEAVLRQYWMPDDITVECYDCTSKFTSFRRRHHCRVCGQVFCSKCCNSYIPGKQIGYSGSLRVCTFCNGFFLNFMEQGLQGATETHLLNVNYNGARRQSMEEVSNLAQSPIVGKGARKASASAVLYGTTGSCEVNSLQDVKESKETVILKDPAALARLMARILDLDVGIQLETHRYYFRTYQDTFQGCKLIDWLISQDVHTSRGQAVAIGQALLTAGFLGSISNQPVFVDGTELYQPIKRPTVIIEDVNDGDVAAPDHLKEPLWLQELAESPFQPEKRTSGSIKNENRHRSGEFGFSQSSAKELQVDIGNLRENVEKNETVVGDTLALDEVYSKHESLYLDRLAKGNHLTEEWRNILKTLADEAVRTVVPDIKYNMDEMDIRCYVKIKCVGGGNRVNSRLISGEVCSLKLTHRGMATQLIKPRIALVANSIFFQREENRMISIDTLTMQEEEYIKNVTQKLLQSKPNLVLVEKTVSRLAQDILLREGVSLALNVKYRVLERLERLTGAKIITSIDSMLTAPTLGSCLSFYVVNSLEHEDKKSLLVFDGCSPELGGTIILQGETRLTLVRLKAILKRLLLLQFNWKFERGFILNEYGWITKQEIQQDQTELWDLSVSPFIKVRKSELVPGVCEGAEAIQELNQPETKPHIQDRRGSKSSKFDMHPWCQGFVGQKLSRPASDPMVQDSLALFRTAGWRVGKTKQPKEEEKQKLTVSLPPDHCENLPVLFSSFSVNSIVAPNFCVVPWVVNMGLYGNFDIPLGGFLENFCFNKDYLCPNKQCTTPILEHTRRFCHSGGSVSVHMQRLEAPIMGEEMDRLMMWKYCTQCGLITPIVPVTAETWSLSFAMFLHLLFHESKLIRRGSDRPDAKCFHSLHQEHLTCFGKLDTVATFKFNKLQVWKLVPPCPQPELPDFLMEKAALLQKLTTLKKQGTGVYSSVLEKLHEIKIEDTEPMSVKLMSQQEEDFKDYRSRVEKLEEQIVSQEEHDANMIKMLDILTRDVMLAQQQWNKKLLQLGSSTPRIYRKNLSSASNESDSGQSSSQLSKKPVIFVEPRQTSTNPPYIKENDTVKKFISTILPTEREDLVSNPFPPGNHLITNLGGNIQDPPSPNLVYETEPSSIIHFLLNCDQYQSFLTGAEDSNPHLELQFSSDAAQFYSCSYFTKQFHQLRNDIFLDKEEKFLASLSTCRRWEAMGGKSGLLFFKTRDERFILKQMSRFEFQSFSEFAPHYFKYIRQCKESDTKTLLGKIVGVYKVGYKSEATRTGMKMDLLIMENLFYKKDVDKSYDLKGSIRNRLTNTEGKNNTAQVLLDENLVRGSCESPLYINASDKDILVEAIKRDTAFLALHQMMDYSLLAGVCRSSGELVVGIIDYIRTFTWDKKLETLVKSVKSSGVFGGPAKTPTVINPELYRKRFSDAMDSYFLLVPD